MKVYVNSVVISVEGQFGYFLMGQNFVDGRYKDDRKS